MRRLSQLCLLALASLVVADQAYYENAYNNSSYAYDDDQADDGYAANGDDAYQQQDDAAGDDDAAQQYYYANLNQDNGSFSAGDDYIKYWTDYAILPKRCIV